MVCEKKEKNLKISPEALFCDCPLVFVRTHSRRAQRKECMQGKPSSGFPCILSRPPAGDRFCAAKALAPKSRLWRPHQVVRHKRFAAGKTLAQAKPWRRRNSFPPSSFDPLGVERPRGAEPKNKRPPKAVFYFWSRVRESNPPPRLGKPMYYRCTNPAQRSYYSREFRPLQPKNAVRHDFSFSRIG